MQLGCSMCKKRISLQDHRKYPEVSVLRCWTTCWRVWRLWYRCSQIQRSRRYGLSNDCQWSHNFGFTIFWIPLMFFLYKPYLRFLVETEAFKNNSDGYRAAFPWVPPPWVLNGLLFFLLPFKMQDNGPYTHETPLCHTLEAPWKFQLSGPPASFDTLRVQERPEIATGRVWRGDVFQAQESGSLWKWGSHRLDGLS